MQEPITYNSNKDYEVPQMPTDSISQLCWNPAADILAAGSWNSEVRIWEVQKSMDRFNAVPKMIYTHNAPVLCVCQSPDGKVFSGSCDTTAKYVSLNNLQAQPTQIAKHDMPIKTIDYVTKHNCIMTGSWDKTVRYWDLRQPKQIAVLQVPERVYAASVHGNYAVIATADRKISIIDLNQPTKVFKEIESPLRFQSRTIAMFPDGQGFALGSIEGRVAIQYFVEDQNAGKKNFAFKCHRENNDIYAVNSISFHPIFGTFSTAGADGTFHFWDKDSKSRCAQFKKMDAPVVSTAFSRDGTAFAYAVSYDWSKGNEHYNKAYGAHIMIKSPLEKDIKPKKKK